MKWLLLVLIHTYWRLIPTERRRQCLFAKSCSRHVFDTAQEQGGLAGLSELWSRTRKCRPGYRMLQQRDADGMRLIRLADSSVVRLEAMAARLRDAAT